MRDPIKVKEWFDSLFDKTHVVILQEEGEIFGLLYGMDVLGDPREQYTGKDLVAYWQATPSDSRIVTFVNDGVYYVILKNIENAPLGFMLVASKEIDAITMFFCDEEEGYVNESIVEYLQQLRDSIYGTDKNAEA